MEKVLSRKSGICPKLKKNRAKFNLVKLALQNVRLICRKSALSVPKKARNIDLRAENSVKPSKTDNRQHFRNEKQYRGYDCEVLRPVPKHNNRRKVHFSLIQIQYFGGAIAIPA